MKNSAKLGDLSKKLKDILESDEINFSLVAKIASEISQLDDSSASFSVSSSIVRRLGEELVSKQETALGELIKNCYDADATAVTVIFSGQDKRNGRLIISDNGVGMTPEQLRNGFLRIASNEKILQPLSQRYRRRRAGEKGIGRFAVERLGRKLRVVTQTASQENATELIINWDDFEKHQDLLTIRNSIRRIPKTRTEGTDLFIDSLRETWNLEQIQKVYSYVTDLIEYPLRSASELSTEHLTESQTTEIADPNKDTFSVDFRLRQGVLTESILTPLPNLLEHATAYVEGEVDAHGNWHYRFKSSSLGVDEELNENLVTKEDRISLPIRYLKNVYFKAYYYVFDKDEVKNIGRKKLQSDVRARSGIRLYRNGFRVPPYGNSGDDWLGFSESEAKRELLPPHGNRNWIGYVSVNDPENRYLKETSSREGVIENDYFLELRNFVAQALLSIVIRAGRTRKRKVFAHDRAFGGERANRVQAAAKKAARLLTELKKLRSKPRSAGSENEVTEDLEQLGKEIEAVVLDSNALASEIGMLRVLASMGLSITLFSHEVRGLLSSTLSNIELHLSGTDISDSFKNALSSLKKSLLELRTFTGYYDQTAAAAIDRSINGIDLLPQLEDFRERFKNHANQRGVNLELTYSAKLAFRPVAIHEAEIAAILLNLFSNSMKAIAKVQPKRAGLIEMRLEYTDDAIISFLDNGTGIDPRIQDKMFEPFVTTSNTVRQSKPGDPDSLGTGLGLTIVRDAIASAGGSIKTASPPAGFSTCFQIRIPFMRQDSND